MTVDSDAPYGWRGRAAVTVLLVLVTVVAAAIVTPFSRGAGSGAVLLPDCSNVAFGGRVAPAEWSSGCTGGSVNLGGLSWQSWGGPAASASGVVHYNNCEPDCARGSIADYPVEFSVDEVQRCASRLGPRSYYTRFTTVIDFPPENIAGQAPGRSQPISFSASCPTPGYLVKTRSKGAAFGAFEESGEYDAGQFDLYFGPASSRKRDRYQGCVKHWRNIGLTVWVVSLDPESNPCESGRFLKAVLRGRRWHTPSGIRPGVSAHKVAAASVRGCTVRLCRTKGYVLSQHHSECSIGRYPSVIAATRHGRVARLLVISHFCE